MHKLLLAAFMVNVAAPCLLGAQDTLVVQSNGSPALKDLLGCTDRNVTTDGGMERALESFQEWVLGG